LKSAELLRAGGQYASALFHCHLAVEKALKSLYMERHRKDAPLTHDLLQIALRVKDEWTEEEKKLFADLTEYSVAARYDDPFWAEREATNENVRMWLERIDKIFSTLFYAA
jgi:HEPN domain-containing protein